MDPREGARMSTVNTRDKKGYERNVESGEERMLPTAGKRKRVKGKSKNSNERIRIRRKEEEGEKEEQ